MPEHTMIRYVDTDALRAKREAIDQEIARHRDAIVASQEAVAALEQKRNELEISERIIAEFGVERPVNGHADEKTDFRAYPQNQRQRKKPPNLPTIPDMIFAALRDAREQGKSGMWPRDLVAFIRKTYWPEAPSEAINPIAWRMWSKDRTLEKDETAGYYLRSEKEPEARRDDNRSFTFGEH
jgi:hypothetical protein